MTAHNYFVSSESNISLFGHCIRGLKQEGNIQLLKLTAILLKASLTHSKDFSTSTEGRNVFDAESTEG